MAKLIKFDKSIKEKRKSEVVLVFDRYYEKPPNPMLLMLGRILLCCGITVCGMMFILNNYDLPVDFFAAGAACVGFTAVFSALFMLVRKRIAIPIMVFVCGIVVWHNLEGIWGELSYFTDSILLQFDGRFVSFNDRLFHPEIVGTNTLIKSVYADKVMAGVIICCALFSLVTAASMFRKPHFMPSLLAFFGMWVPRLMAERMLFNFWLIPVGALYAGAIAMTVSHKEGLAIKRGFASSYRRTVQHNEKVFTVRTASAPVGKRLRMRGVFYSKYFSLALCAVVMFTTLGIAVNAAVGNTHGINYSPLYSFVGSLGSSVGISSPFTSGPVSEYFTSPDLNAHTQSAGLSIRSPGNGEAPVMSVVNNTSLPLYLRGDVGIDFNGKTWTSPVQGLPNKWKENELDKYYKPVEMEILSMFLANGNNTVEEGSFSVDYLCDTAVVFLPTYFTGYEKLAADNYSVYGDYCVRLPSGKKRPPAMRSNVYIPKFSGTDAMDRHYALTAINIASINVGLRDFEKSFDFKTGKYNYFRNYQTFVKSAYMNVPDDLHDVISTFFSNANYSDGYFDWSFHENVINSYDPLHRYNVAREVADYLREHYEYSLDANIDYSDPINSFLNDVKSGHCALFASSMTMIMRHLGIPARYCTGFVAPVSVTGEPTVLRSKNLHAWCEVYFNELGWVTFDPTSSAAVDAVVNGTAVSGTSDSSGTHSDSSDGSDSSDSSGSSEVSDSSDITSSGESVSSDVSTDSESHGYSDGADSEGSSSVGSYGLGTDGKKINILPFIMGILGFFAVAAVIILVIYRIKLFDKNAKNRLKRFYSSENSEGVYSKLVGMLKVCRITPAGGEMTGEFFERAEKSLEGCGITHYSKLLEELAFGSRELSDSEKAQLGRLTERVFVTADKKANILGKVRLRLLIMK